VQIWEKIPGSTSGTNSLPQETAALRRCMETARKKSQGGHGFAKETVGGREKKCKEKNLDSSDLKSSAHEHKVNGKASGSLNSERPKPYSPRERGRT